MEFLATELLKRGADLETKDDYGYTLLLKAVKNDAPGNVIDRLLECGGNVHAVAEDRKTALHFAAQKHEKRMMEIMIKHLKGDLKVQSKFVNAQDSVGWTPLHEAAYYGSKVAAVILIKKG